VKHLRLFLSFLSFYKLKAPIRIIVIDTKKKETHTHTNEFVQLYTLKAQEEEEKKRDTCNLLLIVMINDPCRQLYSLVNRDQLVHDQICQIRMNDTCSDR